MHLIIILSLSLNITYKPLVRQNHWLWLSYSNIVLKTGRICLSVCQNSFFLPENRIKCIQQYFIYFKVQFHFCFLFLFIISSIILTHLSMSMYSPCLPLLMYKRKIRKLCVKLQNQTIHTLNATSSFLFNALSSEIHCLFHWDYA